MIEYKHNQAITAGQMIDLLKRSTLAERRPVDRIDIFEDMLSHPCLMVTAWHNQQLVGLARTLTDYSYVAYLADLAVDEVYQQQGIGKALIAKTQQQLKESCMLVLLAAPKANNYYQHLGFEANPRAWVCHGKY